MASTTFPVPIEPSAPSRRSSSLRKAWPWLVVALMVVPAVWHVVDFEEDADPEFPAVVRPVFSRFPPSAYRLAEPGDTLDRIMIYMTAAGVVLATGGLLLFRGRALWPAAMALSVAGLWYSATPGPTVDGWYGLGWRSIGDPIAPTGVRASLLLAAIALSIVVTINVYRVRHRLLAYWANAQSTGTSGLWIAGLALVAARQFEISGVEPEGYWPRCAMIWGLVAFDLAMLIEVAPGFRSIAHPLVFLPLVPAVWLALVVAGIAVTWYHRPLARLKVVEPGRIFISAMPTVRGLEVAHARHHFRTIINLFPEDTQLRSPLLPDELRFAREQRIHYVGSPSEPSEEASSAFLDQTLALAQDPAAWPILIHCHGCMDRSPAWMGIYDFVVKKRPLLAVMQEIERHRGYRPKASVILLYNRVLAPRAGERYWKDPTATRLRECAAGTVDPAFHNRGTGTVRWSGVTGKSDRPR